MLHPIIDLLKRIVAALPDYAGGGSIQQGYEITSVNSAGSVLSVDIYGDVPTCCFGYYNNVDSVGSYMKSVTFKGGTTKIGYGAFQKTAITEITIPDSVNAIGAQAFRGSTALAHYTHENAQNLYGYGGGATSALANGLSYLQTMQLGAVGKPVTAMYYQTWNNTSAPSTAVFTIYCVGGNVDSFLSSMRQKLTSQKIVFKAAETTTYNGTTYNAGDTILTSEVTP